MSGSECQREKLMERAHQAAAVHGVYAVAHAAKIDYCRLAEGLAASKGCWSASAEGRRHSRSQTGAGDGKPGQTRCDGGDTLQGAPGDAVFAARVSRCGDDGAAVG